MIDHELRMCAYVQLACLSHHKRQALRRDQFLLLAGAEACRAGWPDVGERCRELLAASNPRHMAARFSTMADALRQEDFERLVTQQERHCPAEKAEHLLQQLGRDPRGDQLDQPRGERMLEFLAEINQDRAT